MSEPMQLINAMAVCPVCGSKHAVRVNPLYMPPPAGKRPGVKIGCPKWTDCSSEQKCSYYFMRVKCDICLLARATNSMRDECKRKGWNSG